MGFQVFRSNMSEKLCLKWNDFQDNINTEFGKLRSEHEFSYVTLACEDGQQVEAHKVILATSSPFFHNMLRRNKHPHPLIYMRGVKSEDLVAIVDFLYRGEANVYQENIEAFLQIAQELNLKGLTGSNPEEENGVEEPKLTDSNKKPTRKNNSSYKNRIEDSSFNDESVLDQHYSETKEDVGTLVVQNNHPLSATNINNIQELEEQVKIMMTKSENRTADGKQFAYTCTVCGKEGFRGSTKDHIEANHLEGVSIPCTSCEKTFRTRGALRKHQCVNTYKYLFQDQKCPEIA